MEVNIAKYVAKLIFCMKPAVCRHNRWDMVTPHYSENIFLELSRFNSDDSWSSLYVYQSHPYKEFVPLWSTLLNVMMDGQRAVKRCKVMSTPLSISVITYRGHHLMGQPRAFMHAWQNSLVRRQEFVCAETSSRHRRFCFCWCVVFMVSNVQIQKPKTQRAN